MKKKVTLFENKVDCCGCEACMDICPKKAIQMYPDNYGFIYPIIDMDKCITCMACKRVCGYQNEKEILSSPIHKTFAAVTNNTDIMKSASGGVFASIAKTVLENGGIVCGASIEKESGKFIVKHIIVDEIVNLEKLQGSKYVQSSIGDIYISVRDYLLKGTLVLFSGTPCQVDGFKSFLGKDYKNLITLDIICHGVPNIQMFQDYISELERKIHGDIISFEFRDKTKGWGYVGKAIYKNKNNELVELPVPAGESSYYNFFLNSYISRENCYKCKYANKNRVGDITAGDYWGIKEVHPELLNMNGKVFNEKSGVSGVIVNTEKGDKFINSFRESICLYESEFKFFAKNNSQLSRPSLIKKEREEILRLYSEEGYEAVDKWFIKKKGIKLYLVKLKNRISFILNK